MSAQWRRLAAPAIALLAIASSVVGIINRFTYDDRYIVEQNVAAHTLAGWWRVFHESYWPKTFAPEGYRPLTMLAFRLEWVVGSGNPAVFHGVNILLYALSSVLVFFLAKRLLPFWAAWVCAAFFAVHPVHVEAVGNVVGQSELLVAVAILPAMLLYLRDRQAGPLRARTALAIVLLYALACFSKEHGIVLPALLVAAEFTVIDDQRSWYARDRMVIPLLAGLAIVAVAFVLVHRTVLAGHGLGGFAPFAPFSALHLSSRDRVLTAVSVVPQWARLLFWPASLSAEYGPPEFEIAQGYALVQLPGFVMLVTIFGACVALRRRQPVVSFGILFAAITLLPSSNFLLPTGILIAERTLFLPSVGAMLGLGAAVVYLDGALRRTPASRRRVSLALQAAFAATVIAGTYRSLQRTRVWHDNDRLFRQSVVDAPGSYHAHYMLGTWAFENKRKREGEAEFRKALSLFPYDPFLSFNLGEQYRGAELFSAAIPMYQWSFRLDKNFSLGRTAYAYSLLRVGNYEQSRVAAADALRRGGDTTTLRRLMFVADSLQAIHAKQADSTPVALAGAPSKVPDSMQKAGGKRGKSRGE